LAGSRAKIFAVDNFQGDSSCAEDRAWYEHHFRRLGSKSTLEYFRANVASLDLTARTEPVISDSLAAAQALAAHRGAVDLIFIDGDHSYTACRADIEAWTPFLKP